MMIFVALALCSFCLTDAQVTHSARLQPWPLSIQSTGRCCSNSPTELLSCLGLTSGEGQEATKDVAIFTYVEAEQDTNKHFAVPDILDFATYHAAVMSAYAEQNDYAYKFITPGSPLATVAGESDVRWNKVKLLIDALDSDRGWARNTKYIAWIDADAIVLDLGLRLELVLEQQYPQADFVASADIRQGYVNSGFLLLRNTPWIRQFLQEWWTIADRGALCDQDAFDLVYSTYARRDSQHQRGAGSGSGSEQQSLQQKVVILPRDALNTDPPATLKLLPHNQILHLMGESTAFRNGVFRNAFDAICSARTGAILPAQLGLHRRLLHEQAIKVYRKEANDKIAQASELDALNEAYDVRVQIFALTFQWLERGHATFRALEINLANMENTDVGDKSSDSMVIAQQLRDAKNEMASSLLQLLKRAAEAGNDVFGAAQNTDQKRDAATKTFRVLEELLDRVDVSSKFVPAHMQALMHQNLAFMEYELAMSIQLPSSENSESTVVGVVGNRRVAKKVTQRRGHLQAAKTHAQHSTEIFEKYFESTEDKSIRGERIHSLQILAAVYCSMDDSYTEGIAVWKTATNLAKKNLQGVRMGTALDLYGSILHNSAVCHLQASEYDEALRLAKGAVLAREEFSSQQGLPLDSDVDGVDLASSNPVLGMARDLLKSIRTHLSKDEAHFEPPSKGTSDSSTKHSSSGAASVHSLSDFDEQEWEECEEGEEGCEAFYVHDTDEEIAEVDIEIDGTQAADITLEQSAAVDVSGGFGSLKGLQHRSKGLEDTLDNIDAFMATLKHKTKEQQEKIKTERAPIPTDSPRTENVPSVPARNPLDFDPGEWEECEEGDEGCEVFMVSEEDVNQGDLLTDEHPVRTEERGRETVGGTRHDTNSDVRDVRDDEDGEDDEDDEDIREAQLMWAAQTAPFNRQEGK
eukprot:GSChrysophyteH1.ASY1.ANO1.2501.1 assembled CDS